MRARLKTLAVAAFLFITAGVQAATYPEKPVKIIVPYPAGQGTDIATRFLADHLSDALGQPFVVENVGGAGGMIGAQMAARAPADGYTLVMGTNATHVLNPYLYSSVGFDPENDFEPVILTGTLPMVLVTHPESPFNSVHEVLAAARNGGPSSDIATPSTSARMVLELLKEQSRTPLFMRPYKSSAMAITGVTTGQVPLSIDTITATRRHINERSLKAIAVTSGRRTELLPGVPTVAEQGLAGFEMIAWNALYAPKGTPPHVIEHINRELQGLLSRAEARKHLNTIGFEPGGGSPQDLTNFAAAERRKWRPVIEKAGLKAN